jgi:hypothetical protein
MYIYKAHYILYAYYRSNIGEITWQYDYIVYSVPHFVYICVLYIYIHYLEWCPEKLSGIYSVYICCCIYMCAVYIVLSHMPRNYYLVYICSVYIQAIYTGKIQMIHWVMKSIAVSRISLGYIYVYSMHLL